MGIEPDTVIKSGLSENASARACQEALRLCVSTRIPAAPPHVPPSEKAEDWPHGYPPTELYREKPAPLGTLPRLFLSSLKVQTPLGDAIEGDKVIVSIDVPIRDEVRGYESRFNRVIGFLEGLMAPKKLVASELETPGGAVIMERADLIEALNTFAEIYKTPHNALAKKLGRIEELGRA